MKRMIALVLCALMLFSIFTGCTPAQPTEPEENREWVEIVKNCYIIDDDTRQILDRTTFELKGWMEKVDGTTFEDGYSAGVKLDGYMNIAAYPIPREDFPGSTPTVHIHENYVLYGWTPAIFSADPAADPTYDTQYHAFFALENPEWNWIQIICGEEVLLAVRADSEEEAWDNYTNFMKVYMDLD